MKKQKVGQDVLEVLSECTVDGNVVKINSGQLDRPLYTAVNEILVALGGKWNRKQAGHVFADNPAEKLDDCIRTGEITSPSKNGFFPTPKGLADQLVAEAKIESHHTVLEPSFGNGNLIMAAIEAGAKDIDGCEFNPALVVHTTKRLQALPEIAETLRPTVDLYSGDFLNATMLRPSYDRIIMNPPFEMLGDVKHVLHAYELLAPGGRLVAIMSPGVMFRREAPAVKLRALLESAGAGEVEFAEIEHLPDNSFKESGTGVNTIMLTIQKGAA